VFAQPPSSRRRACAVVVCLLLFVIWMAEGSKTTDLDALSSQDVGGTPARLRFLREFSGADDVARETHPVLDRSVDIIAGPGEEHTSIDRMVAPYGVTTDRAHRVYVTDPDAGAVHIFDFERSKYSVLGGQGSHIRMPSGIAADSEGNIYVTDTALAAVLVYAANGRFLHYLGKVAGGESYFQTPTGIAIHDATGHIYVCDSRRHMVLLLDKKGHILSHIGKRWGGKGPGEFRYPSQVAISGEDVLVLDRGNSRIQVLDLEGHFRREIKLEEVNTDAGLAVDEDKNIYVSDPQFSAIHVFSYEGQLLYKFGQAGTKAGDFDAPSGLWVEAGKGLYVADTKNKRVQLFQIEGRQVH
jgi:DNA-binding beta-propeller fold protein YncE